MTIQPPSIKGWCPGALRPMPSGDGLIVRLRLTAGILSSSLAHAIADLSRRYGNGLIDLSQRANLQLRGVRDADIAALQAELSNLGLLDPDEASESIRNIIAPPLCGLSDIDGHDQNTDHRFPTPAFDGLDLVRDLESALAASPDLHALPGKFGFLIDDGSAISLDSIPSDIRLTPHNGQILISLGGTAQTARPVALVPIKDAIPTALNYARQFLTHPPARRMRDIAHLFPALDLGLFKGSVGRHNPSPQGKVDAKRPEGVVVGEDNAVQNESDRTEKGPEGAVTGKDCVAFQDSQILTGKTGESLSPHPPVIGHFPRYTGVGIPYGRLTANQLDLLANHVPELRLTPFRAILLISPNPFTSPGFILSPADPRLAISACPGIGACPSGTIDAREIADRLALILKPGLTLHVSGCAKGCAHPGPADITLTGTLAGIDFIRGGQANAAPEQRGLDLADVIVILAQKADPS